MIRRSLAGALMAAVLVWFGSASAVDAGPSSFRYVDVSDRLPPDINLPATDTLDVDFADVDNDGDLDIFVADGTATPEPRFNKLYINDGDGHFTDETFRLPSGSPANSTEVDFADIDGDGDVDLIVVNIGQDLVLINDGGGHFSDETASRFPVTTDSTRKGVLADFDGDGCLDLFMGNSRNQQNRLYRNDCSGVFSDVTAGNVPTRADTTTDVDVVDLDDDGDLDLYITNAGNFLFGHGFLGDQNVYLRNNGHGAFHDKTAVYFVARADPSTNAAFGDIDGDGDRDLLIGNSTSLGGEETLYNRRRCPGQGQNCQ